MILDELAWIASFSDAFGRGRVNMTFRLAHVNGEPHFPRHHTVEKLNHFSSTIEMILNQLEFTWMRGHESKWRCVWALREE